MGILDFDDHNTKFLNDSQIGELFWDVLVVDDVPAVHDVTTQALKDVCFAGKKIRIHHAHNADQARQVLKARTTTALVLLDIALKTENDGLELIHWIRNTQKNSKIQIAVFTGNSDLTTEYDLIDTYDINDFLYKKDATWQKLLILVKKAIRTFKTHWDLEAELNHRQKIEKELKEKEEQLKDLLDHIGDLVWQTDHTGTFSRISGDTKTITGFSAKELTGQSFESSMTKECLESVWPDIQDQMKKNKGFLNIEISRYHKNGQIKYYLTSGKPLYDTKGELLGYRGAEKDITDLVLSEMEKKELIAQLRHAQRLEAMGTLAGGIAHDFNNILGGILGYAQLLQFDLEDNTPAHTRAGHIIAGCNRAKNLILQILDFSRQRESTSPKMMTDPSQIVNETYKLLKATIPSSIKLITDVTPDSGHIQADPSQIHQVIMNLCTNARQAIETDIGEITIALKPVTLTPENHTRGPALDLDYGDYVTICVKDTGKGIESDTLDKIFHPYFTTKKRGDGTGLGLSVVHGIVSRFNGAITIDTSPGKGTVFTLFFPKHIPTDTKVPAYQSPIIKGKASVLFIDDEPMLVDIGRMMLEKLGYKVMATDNPLSGLEAIKERPERFDIVITDMTMPDIHGSELAKRIKKINPGIPVILATGFSNIVKAQKATPEGIDAVLPKPITMDNISQALHQLLPA